MLLRPSSERIRQKLSKYFQDKPGDLNCFEIINRQREREREGGAVSSSNMLLTTNGSVIMIDRPQSLSSGILTVVGTDQYLHWT